MLYLDGRIVDPGQARIDPRDRGFLLGDGVFETMRADRGGVRFLDRHLDRLEAGAAVLGIPLPRDRAALGKACLEVLDANRLGDRIAALRLTLSRGPGPRGLHPPAEPAPTLLIAATAIADAAPSPARVVISGIRRNEHSPLSRIKSLSYLDNVLALREAREHGADEAIICNTAGRLACASAANLFLVRNDALLTPRLDEGVLPGITRSVLLEVARDLGIPAEQARLPTSALERADEALLSNSLLGIRSIVEINGVQVGKGGAGPLTRRLQRAYAERTHQADRSFDRIQGPRRGLSTGCRQA
jgi:branched-chain amino acid aminotransferase